MRIAAPPRSALFALALAACHPAATPERVLDEYFAHVKAGRVAAAYALTTPEYRARHTQAAFAIAVARQPILERGEHGRALRTTSIELGGDRDLPVRVVDEGGRLSLAEDPLELYASDTPEAALRAFARAVRLGRRDRVLPLVAPSLRERVSVQGDLPPAIVETARTIEHRLREPLGPLVTDGVTTSWLLGDAHAISLERGPNGWWITAF